MTTTDQKLEKILEHTESTSSKLTALTSGVEELQTSLTSLKSDFNEVRDNVTNLQTQVTDIKNRLDSCNTEVLEVKLSEVCLAQDKLQRYIRKNNLMIYGVPEVQNEDIFKIVSKLAELLNMDVRMGDIDAIHRIPTCSPCAPRPIVVKFVNRWRKMEILLAAKGKHLKAKMLDNAWPEDNIYLNQQLSPWQQQAHKRLRDLRLKGLKYVNEAMDGKLYVTRESDHSVVKVETEETLLNLERSLGKHNSRQSNP